MKGESRTGSRILELHFNQMLLPDSSTASSKTGQFLSKAFRDSQRAALASCQLPCPHPFPQLPGTAHVRKPASTSSECAASSQQPPGMLFLNWNHGYWELIKELMT